MKLALSLFFLSTVGVTAASSPGVLHVCNRGFCYTKKEPLDPYSSGRISSKRKSGLNFCTDSGGHIRDCELFEILGTEEELEAVECTSNSCERMQEEVVRSNEPLTQVYSSVDGEVVDLDNNDESNQEHVSWKEKPKRGRCYDNSLAYEFDCNLVEILE